MNSQFYAHTDPAGGDWEPLRVHLDEVAELAGKFADRFGARAWGELAGRWHDLGKYSAEFQAYLSAVRDVHAGEIAGRVDHSTAGAQRARGSCSWEKITAPQQCGGVSLPLSLQFQSALPLGERLAKVEQTWVYPK